MKYNKWTLNDSTAHRWLGGIIKGAYDDPRGMGGYPLFVESADGCTVLDVDGNSYLDFNNHHTTLMLGHSPPAVVAALQDQLSSGIAFGHATALEAEITAEICARVPSVEMVRFTNSGTESSLHVCRMVRAITGKGKIAKFEGQYHGKPPFCLSAIFSL
jgi:glutamate-1-semialdehyde 2,1-aminomutase